MVVVIEQTVVISVSVCHIGLAKYNRFDNKSLFSSIDHSKISHRISTRSYCDLSQAFLTSLAVDYIFFSSILREFLALKIVEPENWEHRVELKTSFPLFPRSAISSQSIASRIAQLGLPCTKIESSGRSTV